jgi:hypothetical protein
VFATRAEAVAWFAFDTEEHGHGTNKVATECTLEAMRTEQSRPEGKRGLMDAAGRFTPEERRLGGGNGKLRNLVCGLAGAAPSHSARNKATAI